jgi:O-antigen/teichoic acid export membrane protein
MKMQLAYTLPYGFATMILYMETDIHYYFVSNQFGPAVFAIYAVGCFQIPLVEIISDAVGSVTLPRVSYLQKENRKREIFELIADMVRKIAAINFPILFFLLVFGREFIIVLFTSNYLASLPIFHINVLIIPLTIAACAYDPVLRAYPEHRFFVLKIRTLLILALLCVLWFTTTYFGLLATITAVVSVHAVERSLFAFKAARILELGWKDLVLLKDLPKLALAATFASIFSGLIKLVLHYEPIVLLGIGFVCFLFAYTISIIALGVLRKEEWEAVSHYFHYFTTTKKPADKPA